MKIEQFQEILKKTFKLNNPLSRIMSFEEGDKFSFVIINYEGSAFLCKINKSEMFAAETEDDLEYNVKVEQNGSVNTVMSVFTLKQPGNQCLENI